VFLGDIYGTGLIYALDRVGTPPTLIANSDRIREVLGSTPCYDDLDVIVESALSWEQQLSRG